MQRNIVKYTAEIEALISLFSQGEEGEKGGIFQVYGFPMSGKTSLLQTLVLGMINKNSRLEVHKLPMQIFICTTPGESYWEEKLAQSTSPSDSESLLEASGVSVVFVSINHANDLLNFLTHAKTSFLQENTNIVLVVDSLAYLWQELFLTKRTRNEVEWFYFSLLDRLRDLTRSRSTSQSGRKVILLANNCNCYSSREVFLNNPCTLPSPLGFEGWNSEMDSNIYVELDHGVKLAENLATNQIQRLVILKGDAVVSCELSVKIPV